VGLKVRLLANPEMKCWLPALAFQVVNGMPLTSSAAHSGQCCAQQQGQPTAIANVLAPGCCFHVSKCLRSAGAFHSQLD
jgi:hypothetical protein